MTSNVSIQLSIISRLAHIASWNDELAITSQHTFILDSNPKLCWLLQRIFTVATQAIEAMLSTLLFRSIILVDHSKKREDLTATVKNLKSMFGARRLDRNIAWCKINIKNLHDDGRCLSKQDFASLFHGFELITKEDVEDLLAELNGEQPCVRGVEGESLHSLRHQFHGKTEISSCNPEEIQALEKILLPFEHTEDQFWNKPEEHINAVTFPVTTFGMIETVAWAQHLLKAQRIPLKDWESIFAKRLAQPQLPKNLILHHPSNGYICFSHVVEGGGASKRFFKSLHPLNVPPHILYRGTRGPMPGDNTWDTVHSWLEDVRRELGSSGPIATYEETKRLLENPEEGFVNSPDQKVAFVTNSIGGAQGQRDALCFHNRVLRLNTNCSPGVDKATAALFREVMSTPRETPMIITHNIDKGDIVDTAGDEHLGGGCPHVTLTFRSLSPATSDTKEDQHTWTATNRLSDFLFSGIPSLFSNISGIFEAHVRAAATGLYKEEVLSTEDPATCALAAAYAQHQPPHFDPSWEQVRRYFCPAPSPGFAEFARQHIQTA
jgi:hypothetical protein